MFKAPLLMLLYSEKNHNLGLLENTEIYYFMICKSLKYDILLFIVNILPFQLDYIEKQQSSETSHKLALQQSETELAAVHENLTTLRSEIRSLQQQHEDAQKIADSASQVRLGKAIY